MSVPRLHFLYDWVHADVELLLFRLEIKKLRSLTKSRLEVKILKLYDKTKIKNSNIETK